MILASLSVRIEPIKNNILKNIYIYIYLIIYVINTYIYNILKT